VDARYWEAVGKRYEDEIFASSRSDARSVIRRRLDELADSRRVAVDFGCGVGHYLPLLASRFRVVHGVDFAESLVEQARRRTARLTNVTVHRADLASARTRLPVPRARVAVCANVLISDDAAMRRRILKTIHRCLAPGAHLLLVVPSLESVLFANHMLIEWNRRRGVDEAEAIASGIPATARSMREIAQGLVRIEGVPTKHYLREELEGLLDAAGFTIGGCDKVEYGWETEFERPPNWMTRPGPWDWLCVARKRRPRKVKRP
jgi:SAM-dependent methyltransferase